MNSGPSALNRIVSLVIAMAMIVLGGAAIGWKTTAPWIHDHLETIDLGWFNRAPESSWWIWVLVGILVVGVLLGLWLLSANIRPRHLGSIQLDGSGGSTGKLTLRPGTLAEAIADELSRAPEIASASARAVDDRTRSLLEVTVTSAPETSYDDVIARLRDVKSHVQTAFPDNALRPRFLVHMERKAKKDRRVN